MEALDAGPGTEDSREAEEIPKQINLGARAERFARNLLSSTLSAVGSGMAICVSASTH